MVKNISIYLDLAIYKTQQQQKQLNIFTKLLIKRKKQTNK